MRRDLTRLRLRIEEEFMPQTVQIITSVPGTTPYGAVTRSGWRRMHYKGTSDIPCRLDVSKHYRQATVATQEVNVSEYDLHLPRPFRLTVNSQVFIDGERFEVRKMLDSQGWDLTAVALVVRINSGEAGDVVIPEDALLWDEDYMLGETERLLME